MDLLYFTKFTDAREIALCAKAVHTWIHDPEYFFPFLPKYFKFFSVARRRCAARFARTRSSFVIAKTKILLPEVVLKKIVATD